jgi:glycosyltransferase involved in cell wall biosynthesis
VTLIARLVPIKRVDRFLRIANALRDLPEVWFLVVGDGELRESLRRSAEARSLGDRLVWAGFRQDMPAVLFASDVVVQTSDNEGTPVALIEAQAAGVPVVSTRVGGTSSVVTDERSLASPQDESGLADAARALLADRPLALQKVSAAREHSLNCFKLERLTSDIDHMYSALVDS